MNVQCTHCSTVFRVDPRKVPAGGVRARCSICRAVFEVAADGDAPRPPQPRRRGSAPAAAPRRSRAPAARRGSDARARPARGAAAGPAFQPSRPPGPRRRSGADAVCPQPRPAPRRVRAPRPGRAAAPRSPFGASDPAAKARRLARALVSDIVTYFPDRRDRALADGTLQAGVHGGDQEELGGVRGPGGRPTAKQHAVLPRRAERDPGQGAADLLSAVRGASVRPEVRDALATARCADD